MAILLLQLFFPCWAFVTSFVVLLVSTNIILFMSFLFSIVNEAHKRSIKAKRKWLKRLLKCSQSIESNNINCTGGWQIVFVAFQIIRFCFLKNNVGNWYEIYENGQLNKHLRSLLTLQGYRLKTIYLKERISYFQLIYCFVRFLWHKETILWN